ncbi:MAG: ATP-binding cassette domain-containing protein [Desulfurococcales archaeon]|nr:ATP-binding cassette domain-containing protein [Desulfurococcales archaeon]
MVSITMEDVWVRIEGVEVLRGVNISIEEGVSYAIVGRNGAGKTTLLRTILGIIKPSRGRVIARKGDVILDMTKTPPHRMARLGVGYVPQGRMIFPDLTALENLEVAYGGPVPGDVIEWIYTILPELKRFIDRKGRYMSGGEQQIVAIARALVRKPSLIILDEPLEGLAPRVVKSILDALSEIKKEGVSILITESGAISRVKHIAEWAYGIDRGEIIYRGNLEDIERNPEARKRIWGL